MSPLQSRCSSRLSFLWAFAGCLLLIMPAEAQTGPFTIEQVLSAPLVDSLTASRSGSIAWVANRKGSRNIWVAEPVRGGEYRVSQLTHYPVDDGEDLGELSWDSSGGTLTYVRGGSFEDMSAENTLSLPLGPSMGATVWAVSLQTRSVRAIGPGRDPAASPDGIGVAYLHEGSLWLGRSNGAAAPVELVKDERRITAFEWSPDGRRIAFVSERESNALDIAQHSFIGVYDLAHKTLVWMGPSLDHDTSPVWSPDGRRIAFIRVPVGTQDDARYGVPWGIWIADPSTGRARRLWQADAGPGSVFYSGIGPTALLWGASDHLIFKWERTGWLNLYTVSAHGGLAVAIATGPFEVANMVLSADGRTVVFSCNETDADRRHVWRVPISGGQAVPLTPGLGIEDSPVFGAGGEVVVLHGDARLPLAPALLRGDGTLVPLNPSSIPKEFPASRLVVPLDITFRAPDGIENHAQLFLPPHDVPGIRHPAIVFYHGGPARQMLPGWDPIAAYSYLYGMNQYLASRGYVVLSDNYRGSVGYGLEYRQPPHFGPRGASEYQDERGAALYLDSRSDVDPKRIGVYGGSYGGVMVAMALARASDLYAAGVDYAGIHDWRTLMLGAEAGSGEYFTAAQLQLAYDSSAIASVKTWRSPALIYAADHDQNVDISQSEELVSALRANGHDPQTIVEPNETHDLNRYASWLRFLHATDDFFAQQLGMSR